MDYWRVALKGVDGRDGHLPQGFAPSIVTNGFLAQ